MFVATLLEVVCSLVLLLDTNLYNASMYKEFEANNIYRIFLCSLGLFTLSCFKDDPVDAGLKPGPKDDENLLHIMETNKEEYNKIIRSKVSPRVYSSFLSHITFYWFSDFFEISKDRKTIHYTDIWELEDDLKIEGVVEKFNQEYLEEVKNIEFQNRNSTLKIKYNSYNTIKIFWRAYGNRLLYSSFIKLLMDIITFASPFLLSFMINFVSDINSPKWHGIFIVIGFAISSFLKNIFYCSYSTKIFAISMNLKSSLTNLIYSKAFKLNPTAKKNISQGEINNLVLIDTSKFADFLLFFGKQSTLI